MRLALAQLNPTVGNLEFNCTQLLQAAQAAQAAGADLLIAPELALCGYPPRDLLDQGCFVQDCLASLRHLMQAAPLPMLLGAVVAAGPDPLRAESRLHNAAVAVHQGKLLAIHRKILLPNYDVFDESTGAARRSVKS